MGETCKISDSYACELVQKHSDMVLRLAITYLKNMSDAEDVCQNVFIKLFKQHKSFADAEHEKAWIIRVTINECKDILKSFWKNRFFITDQVEIPMRDEVHKEILSFVLELPLKYRRVIYLFYYEDYSTLEIGCLLNINEATIRTQLKRAREILKKRFEGGIDNEESFCGSYERN